MRKILLITLLVLIPLVVYNLFWKTKPSSSQYTVDELKSLLRKEFKNVYAKDAEFTGKLVELKMVAKEDKVEIIKGYKTKVWSYNGQVPGPEIRIKKGDKLRVVFTNKLPDETTIHWHGVRVPNAMDGVPGVTQDPIQPGETFIYEFVPKDAGTFWFHPHVRGSEQVERGLFGTLIVEDEYVDKYNQDKVLVLDDWRLTRDNQVYPYFNTRMDLMHDGRWGNVITVNGSPNEVLNVNPGERIRLRLVNSSNARVYAPTWDGLNAKIIAVDGLLSREPVDATGFEIAPGNRIDVDITIPTDSASKEFKIYDEFTRYKNLLVTIKVGNNMVKTPTFDYPKNINVPYWKDAINIDIDKEYILQAVGRMGEIRWTINGKAYPDYELFSFKYDTFNKIRFTNKSSRLHPMHLHGQFFKVIARDGKPVDEGFFRDTVLVHPGETVDLAMVPLDKGRWLQHCHILEHPEAGMKTVVEVK